ncbi:HET-domain-containing protein [Delitschia confertaspora ATCC 74209]|uniref:HET-domain-containing protein n=1 Tax=Delitschia confertaspora ATCC 74209 TaxID=1513339 RepID=A0A9P4JWM7_9PLEO|nr:HET-domain-containing protein [Delitschia confertaspora ATCC 74209]
MEQHESMEIDALYSKLPIGLTPRTIRLLSIRPLSTPDNLSAKLEVAELKDGLDFTTISYTWGDPKIYANISVNGHDIGIAKNLTILMHQLLAEEQQQKCENSVRSPGRRFWIDAICMNQNNVNEKEEQVPLMAAIYGIATTTLIWLGPAADDSDLAMDLVNGISDQDFEEFDSSETSSPRWVAHRLLFARQWWRRVWTVQEAILSRYPIVKCGTKEIPLEKFVDFEYVYMKYVREATSKNTVKGALAFRYYTNTPYRKMLWRDIKRWLNGPLTGWYSDIVYFDSTQPRDKVYGLMSMLREESRRFITVDYHTKTDAEVFTEIGVLLLKESGFNILSSVPEPKISDTGMPSWCYQWNKPLWSQPLHSYRYTAFVDDHLQGSLRSWHLTPYFERKLYHDVDELGKSSHMRFSPDLRTLAVRGLEVDSIDYVDAGPTSYPDMNCQDILIIRAQNKERTAMTLAACKRWKAYLDVHKPSSYGGGKGLKEAFWRTICVNSVYDFKKPGYESSGTDAQPIIHDYDASFEKKFDAWMGDLDEEQKRMSEQELELYFREYRTTVVSWCLGRKFVTTEGGYIGLVLGDVRVGDRVVVVKGGVVPLVLRKSDWNGGIEKGYSWKGSSRNAGAESAEIRAGKLVTSLPDQEDIHLTSERKRESLVEEVDIAPGRSSKLDEAPLPIDEVKEENSPGYWKFVGDCYLHGIMNGEYTKEVGLGSLKEFWIR